MTPDRRAPLVSLKRTLFRLLEWLAGLRQRRVLASPTMARAAPLSLWIFVSTIGELNAVQPFIDQLLAELGGPPLTLISDRSTYRDAYRSRYPDAATETLGGEWAEVLDLVARRPPLMLVIAEIPCHLHDAPCRLSYATVHAARRAGAPVVAVNGWLYGYRPPSRMDAIEHALFARDYLAAFDLFMAQTEGVRARLVALGASPARIEVTGNIKFDAMLHAPQAPPDGPLAAALKQRTSRDIIVAGSVTETLDQRAVLLSFQRVRAEAPQALLILAPRHPEDAARMAALRDLLHSLDLPVVLRSQHDAAVAVAGPVLILDTMGELRECYRAAALAYVGTDHNVLEPLAFGCPVFVSGRWEPTYPSYPVYRQLLDIGALHEVGAVEDMPQAWAHFFEGDAATRRQPNERAAAFFGQSGGAVARCMEAMRKHVDLAALRQRTAPSGAASVSAVAPQQAPVVSP